MPPTIHLSKRLSAVAAFVGDGRRIADIGTDHAYVPIALAEAGTIDFAIASDVGAGPVAIARENVDSYGLTGTIDVRLADGLASIRPEDAIDTVVIAGMGGQLIATILAAGIERLDGTETLVLAPHRDADVVRTWLADHGFGILDEDLVEDAGHVYPIMSAGQTQPDVPYTELDLLLGPVLRRKRSPVFLRELARLIEKTTAVLAGLQHARTVPATRVTEMAALLEQLKEEQAHGER